MWLASNWNDYEVLDCTDGEKLERWDRYILLRPDPQVIWKTKRRSKEWKKLNAHYHRSSRGGGEWEFFDLPEEWSIKYHFPEEGITGSDEVTFNLKPFSFKHTGLFPEQAANWDYIFTTIKKELEKRRKEKGDNAEVKGAQPFCLYRWCYACGCYGRCKVAHIWMHRKEWLDGQRKMLCPQDLVMHLSDGLLMTVSSLSNVKYEEEISMML